MREGGAEILGPPPRHLSGRTDLPPLPADAVGAAGRRHRTRRRWWRRRSPRMRPSPLFHRRRLFALLLQLRRLSGLRQRFVALGFILRFPPPHPPPMATTNTTAQKVLAISDGLGTRQTTFHHLPRKYQANDEYATRALASCEDRVRKAQEPKKTGRASAKPDPAPSKRRFCRRSARSSRLLSAPSFNVRTPR